MPRRVLQLIAALLVVCAVGGFTLGFLGAPKRGRLPGEAAPGGKSDASLNAAADARPLNTDEFLTVRPPEPEKAPEEKSETEAVEEAKVAAAPAPKAPAPKAVEAPPPPPEPVEAAPPQPEDPPF
jgi:hypothetical protein